MHFVGAEWRLEREESGWVQLALATWRTPGAPTFPEIHPPIQEHHPGLPLASTRLHSQVPSLGLAQCWVVCQRALSLWLGSLGVLPARGRSPGEQTLL